MKSSFRKLTSWLLAASLVVGLGLSAAPAYASEDDLAEEEGVIDEVNLSEFTLFIENGDLNRTFTDQEMVEEIIGNWAATSGVRYFGSGKQPNSGSSAIFTGGSSAIRIDKGIVLTSGKAVDLPGPNSSGTRNYDNGQPGDTDLTSMLYRSGDKSGRHTKNRSALEFTFTPEADGTLVFPFVFASEEFGRKSDDRNNDGFIFLVNGANYATMNGAKNGPVVSVKNIGSFINNTTKPYPRHTSMDGLTDVMQTAEIPVLAGQEYRVKIAIADYYADRDSKNQYAYRYDSAVFIGAATFTASTPVDTDGPEWPEGAKLHVAEECGIVTLTWPEAADPSIPIDYDVYLGEEKQGTTQNTFFTLNLTQPNDYPVSVIPRDALGNEGNPLRATVTILPEGPSSIQWLGSGQVANGEVYDIQFKAGICAGGDFDKTVAIKLRNAETNSLIAGYVYGQSITFNDETQTYSQLFDTTRFNIKDTLVNIYVYFGSKLKEIGSFRVGNP